jgi:hypothetical protein
MMQDGEIKKEINPSGLYKEVSKRVDEWLSMHQDEKFDLDLICRQLETTSSEARKQVTVKLFQEVKKGKLDKNDKIYRYVNREVKPLDWINADVTDSIEVLWPYGIEDSTRFGFDGHIIVPRKSIIIVAGVTNTGKTTFALNFLWMNMDIHPCTLMGNEYEPSQFKRRASYMKFQEPIDENGKPKFELIERHEDWKDVIRPDNINIIDWLNLGDKFYEIGNIIDGIKQKLNKGIALILIQKDAQKATGMGGMWGTHLASLYLNMDFGKVSVVKCKEWNGHNPNNEMYGFDIVNHGSQFHNIRSVTTCRKCYGKSAGGAYKCPECYGKGYIDKEKGE